MEYIQTHLIMLVMPLGIMAVLGILAKNLPELLANKAAALIDKAFNAGDPADDELFCAAIVWVEKKYGSGSGAEKADKLTALLISMLPLQYRIFATQKVKDKVKEVFQKSFDRLEAVALKELKEHQPPAAPPVP